MLSSWHPMEDDIELLRAWRDGNAQAGDALVRRHFDAVWGFFRRRCADAADDLTQRTFEACQTGVSEYRGAGSVKAFLLGIAHKQLLMEFRRRGRSKLAHAEIADEPDPGASPTQVRHIRERRRVILRATRELPVELQVVLDLYYWQELSGAEIATALDLNPTTVRTRLLRAREQLIDQLNVMDIGLAARQTTITYLDAMNPGLQDDA